MTTNEFIDQHKEHFLDELFTFLRIPSVSTDSSRKIEVEQAADFLLNQLNSLKLSRVERYETQGHPIVYGEHCPFDDRPTVLIYGHYDVQPSDPDHLWDTPPFEPTIKDGKIYARGASDDKGQSFTHVKALQSLIEADGGVPVNVKILLEGEEEIGSPNLVPFIESHRDMLECDMVLISDTSMFGLDQPSITFGLRGLAYMEVEVVGPNRDLHSGVYGGAVENPLNALCKIITQLKDADGVIQIPGFYDKVVDLTPDDRKAMADLPFDETAYKASLDVDAVHGEKGYTTLERASARPTLDVNGIWGGYQGTGSKTVLPSQAHAKITCRLVANQKPERVYKLIKAHLENNRPPGVTVEVKKLAGDADPFLVPRGHNSSQIAGRVLQDLYGKEPLATRVGGSIPVMSTLLTELGIHATMFAFGLDDEKIHAPNEFFRLSSFKKSQVGYCKLLEEFGK